ncbi:MAG: SpoVG family protein [Candidatus Omnitrophica bacterium]|nr:SpoVG family protein [Candidatus Omnitrophota bacterium]MCM8828075.1 SpoVG family protein [Candidatus Omnitrophota bacterium]
MEITETRISPINKPNSRLRAYASVTFDNSFVIREIRVIEGKNGLFIAMPSRKMQKPCPRCNFKNPVTNKYCGQCGAEIKTAEQKNQKTGAQQHKDIAHPINTQFRDYLQKKIVEQYNQQKQSDTTGKESTGN